jgi:hypothetical protein
MENYYTEIKNRSLGSDISILYGWVQIEPLNYNDIIETGDILNFSKKQIIHERTY